MEGSQLPEVLGLCLSFHFLYGFSVKGPYLEKNLPVLNPGNTTFERGSLSTKRLTISLFSVYSKNNRSCKGPLSITYCKPLQVLEHLQVAWAVSRDVLGISKDGDSTASLSSLFQCSTTVKKIFFCLVRISCFSLYQLLLVLSLDTNEKNLASFFTPLTIRSLYILLRFS